MPGLVLRSANAFFSFLEKVNQRKGDEKAPESNLSSSSFRAVSQNMTFQTEVPERSVHECRQMRSDALISCAVGISA